MSVSGRGQLDPAREEGGFQVDLLGVNNVHRESLVAVGIARERTRMPIPVALGFGGLAVHVAGPEFRAWRQFEPLELLFVVLHHERGLREQLAFLGEDGGEFGAVGHGVEHR